jgi:hypothetical protein
MFIKLELATFAVNRPIVVLEGFRTHRTERHGVTSILNARPQTRTLATDQGALDRSGPRFAVTTAPILDVIE